MPLSKRLFWVGVVIVVMLFWGVASQDWAVTAKFRTSVNLTCTDHRVNMSQISQADRLRWILPTGNVLQKDMKNMRIELHGKGEILQIRQLDEEDFGIYYCLILYQSSHKDSVIKKGININGPYWGDLLDVYRINIIVGCIAAAVVAVIMLACCFLYDRNVKQTIYIDDEAVELALHHKQKRDEGHVNSSMRSDDFAKGEDDVGNNQRFPEPKEERLGTRTGNDAPPEYDYEPTTHL